MNDQTADLYTHAAGLSLAEERLRRQRRAVLHLVDRAMVVVEIHADGSLRARTPGHIRLAPELWEPLHRAGLVAWSGRDNDLMVRGPHFPEAFLAARCEDLDPADRRALQDVQAGRDTSARDGLIASGMLVEVDGRPVAGPSFPDHMHNELTRRGIAQHMHRIGRRAFVATLPPVEDRMVQQCGIVHFECCPVGLRWYVAVTILDIETGEPRAIGLVGHRLHRNLTDAIGAMEAVATLVDMGDYQGAAMAITRRLPPHGYESMILHGVR